MTFLDVDSRLDDSLGLHNRDFGIRDCKTAASVTHHRVEFMQTVANEFDFGNGLTLCFCKQFDILFFGRNEFVERRIQETNGDRHAFECFHQAFEVCLLHGLDCRKCFDAFFNGLGANHFTEFIYSARSEEHVFGTNKTDTLCAEFRCTLCVLRSIRIGANTECFVLVCEFHDSSEITAVGVCRNSLDNGVVDVARRAVERETVAFVEDLSAEFEELLFFVHLDVAATGYAAGTHTASNDRRVRSLSAANGENALCILHAFDVFRRRFESDENDLLACFAFFHCVFCGENDSACRCARRCRDTLADDVLLIGDFECLCVELRVEQHIESLCIDLKKCFFLVDHAFVDKVASDADCSRCGTLTVSCLKHEEFALFNCEFHILHVFVVIFQSLANVLELFINVRENFCHLGDRHRGANACDDVFALCVHKELAHEAFFAGCGVTSECNACAAIVAHVAERHHLHVDCGTPAVRDIVVHTVNVCARVVPAAENCFDCLEELFLRIGREVLTELSLVLCFELFCEFVEIVCAELDVLSDAAIFFHLVDEFFKVFLADFHNDVGEHLDETSVAVPSPSGIAGFLCEHVHDLLVETEIENGVHHARHRRSCARADGYEKRIFCIAEFLAGDCFEFLNIIHDFGFDGIVDVSAVFIVLSARFRRDGESLRNGKTDVGHFCEVCTFATEKLTHLRIALCEQINIFLLHLEVLLKISFILNYHTKTRAILQEKNISYKSIFIFYIIYTVYGRNTHPFQVPETRKPSKKVLRQRNVQSLLKYVAQAENIC